MSGRELRLFKPTLLPIVGNRDGGSPRGAAWPGSLLVARPRLISAPLAVAVLVSSLCTHRSGLGLGQQCDELASDGTPTYPFCCLDRLR
jgi:hypothetical protein